MPTELPADAAGCALTVTALDDRAAWLEQRRQGIGGSDAAAACGLSPWKSPLALWLEKTGQLDDRPDHEAIEWGIRLEPVVIDAFQDRTGLHVIANQYDLYRHPDRPWMIATPDGFVYESAYDEAPLGLYEGKTASAFKAADWADNQIPDQYTIQVQHNLAVCGLDHAWVAALIGGNRLVIVETERDQQLIDQLVELEHRFWQRVIEDRPPPADGSDATSDALKNRYAEPDPGSVIDLDPMVLGWLTDRAAARARRDAADQAIATVDNQLKALLGDHEIGLVDGQPAVTWKLTDRAGFVVEPTRYRKLSFPKRKAPG